MVTTDEVVAYLRTMSGSIRGMSSSFYLPWSLKRRILNSLQSSSVDHSGGEASFPVQDTNEATSISALLMDLCAERTITGFGNLTSSLVHAVWQQAFEFWHEGMIWQRGRELVLFHQIRMTPMLSVFVIAMFGFPFVVFYTLWPLNRIGTKIARAYWPEIRQDLWLWLLIISSSFPLLAPSLFPFWLPPLVFWIGVIFVAVWICKEVLEALPQRARMSTAVLVTISILQLGWYKLVPFTVAASMAAMYWFWYPWLHRKDAAESTFPSVMRLLVKIFWPSIGGTLTGYLIDKHWFNVMPLVVYSPLVILIGASIFLLRSTRQAPRPRHVARIVLPKRSAMSGDDTTDFKSEEYGYLAEERRGNTRAPEKQPMRRSLRLNNQDWISTTVDRNSAERLNDRTDVDLQIRQESERAYADGLNRPVNVRNATLQPLPTGFTSRRLPVITPRSNEDRGYWVGST